MTLEIQDTGLGRTDPYVITENDEITTLRAQLAEAKGIITRLCLAVAYNKTSSGALLEAQKSAHEYLNKVTPA